MLISKRKPTPKIWINNKKIENNANKCKHINETFIINANATKETNTQNNKLPPTLIIVIVLNDKNIKIEKESEDFPCKFVFPFVLAPNVR